MSQEDHDILTRIDENMIHIKAWAEKHDALDDDRFKEVKAQVGWIQKMIYGVLGIIAFIKFFMK